MILLNAVAVLVLTLNVNVEAGLTYWDIWNSFTPTWQPLIPNSYNIQKFVNLTDTDDDGYITSEELLAVLDEMDANGDGRVTRYEYVRHYVILHNGRVDTAVAMFDYVDENGDNYLTVDDLGTIEAGISLTDKDKQLSVHAFQVALRQVDLDVQKEVECSSIFVHRLPPVDLQSQKEKCAEMKRMTRTVA